MPDFTLIYLQSHAARASSLRCIGMERWFLMWQHWADNLGRLPFGINNQPNIEFQWRNFSMDIGLAKLAKSYVSAQEAEISILCPYMDILRQAILRRIIVICSRNTAGRTGYSEMLVPAKTRRVVEYIETGLDGDLSLAQLAAVAGVSRAHFARAFRNSVGMSPHQFVRHCRLGKAMSLISDRKMGLAEISQVCGFADQAHLTRSFKCQYGENPTYFGRRSSDLIRSYRYRSTKCFQQSDASYASFSDLDGNGWIFQEVTARLTGHVAPDDDRFAAERVNALQG